MPRTTLTRDTARRTGDALLAFWCVFWVAVGVLTGQAVWQLSALTDTAERSGAALDEAGRALQGLAEVPVVGDATGGLGGEIRDRATDIVATAQEARGDVRRLAVLLGGAVAVLPTAPLLAVYVPGRLRDERETRDVRRAAATEPAEAVEAWLAGRALAHVPLATLRRFSDTPLQDAREGRHAGLADAELARLGLRRSPPPGAPDRQTA